MMAYYLVERTLKRSNIHGNDEIIIKIFIDQRKAIPKVMENDGRVVKRSKLEGLESYIETQLYTKAEFKNFRVNVTQLESKSNSLIRYSDYYVGLISSMCRFLNHSAKK